MLNHYTKQFLQFLHQIYKLLVTLF